MSHKLLVAFVWPIGSGKGKASEILKEHYDCEIYGYSSPLRSIVALIGQEATRENLSNLSLSLRQTFGQDVLEKSAIEAYKRSDKSIIFLDGVRRESDIANLCKMEEFILIYIDAPTELRHKRVTARGQNAGDTDKSFEEFLKDEEHDTEKSIRWLRSLANTVIENTGSEADLEEALISYLRQYIVD